MPIYEYACPACGQQFEKLVRSSDEERKVACPKCGGKRVQRQFSVIATPRIGAQKSSPPSGCGQCGNPGGSCPYK